jgi:hypothetical protein
MTGKIKDLKLEWSFETTESTLLPILMPLIFKWEKEQDQERWYMWQDLPSHRAH